MSSLTTAPSPTPKSNNSTTKAQAWIEIHQEDLMANWKLAVEGQKPYKIEPLR